MQQSCSPSVLARGKRDVRIERLQAWAGGEKARCLRSNVSRRKLEKQVRHAVKEEGP